MVNNAVDLRAVYAGRRVLVTGHTGFKGSWLCEWLLSLGAEVHGYSLPPPTQPSLFEQLGLQGRIASHVIADIRDLDALKAAFRRVQPEFVFHLAAQPLVRESYARPAETFETNVMGTVNVLESARTLYFPGSIAPHPLPPAPSGSIDGRTAFGQPRISILCITTDKCYENTESRRPYKETDPMGGHDPYSCSKGCDELLISSYRRSFFGAPESPVWLASARAGNVIGGGDWAKDRIVPDAMRALSRGEPVPVRNKTSTRPWQHVLEPLCGYLTLGAALDARVRFAEVASGFNFGPDPRENRTVAELVREILKYRKGEWIDKSDPSAVHEAGILNLDIGKAARILGWKPRWDFAETVRQTVSWYASVADGADPAATARRQIEEYTACGCTGNTAENSIPGECNES